MELEWDEDKRLKVLLERDLDFADVTKFDPATIVIVPDTKTILRRAAL